MLCSRQAHSAFIRHQNRQVRLGSRALADPRSFGRGRSWVHETPPAPARLSDDVKLFATTFAGGFLFVSLLIA